VNTPRLKNWTDIKETFHNGALLLGNGQSRAVWNRFDYGSLLDAAASGRINHPLSDQDCSVFDAFKTDNFEQVLGALDQAQKVAQAVNTNPDFLMEVGACSGRIRRALIQAVHWVHLRRDQLSDEVLGKIAEEILCYDAVFTTNYDLIVYWALMNWVDCGGDRNRFRDFLFWTDFSSNARHTFHLVAAEAALNDGRRRTNLFFLHGALHLVRLPNGVEAKLTKNEDSLLDQFYQLVANGSLPLFVSGGDWKDKRRSIRSSRYLEFCLMSLERYDRPLVILGHSMSDLDKHIRELIARWGRRKVAIGIRNGRKEKLVKRISNYTGHFPKAELTFFDSATHPLTAPDLQVPEEADE
jgi:hypothetical protein